MKTWKVNDVTKRKSNIPISIYFSIFLDNYVENRCILSVHVEIFKILFRYDLQRFDIVKTNKKQYVNRDDSFL